MFEINKFVWAEKYRPQKIDDCILPSAIKNTFKSLIASGNVPNLLLTGHAGTGKTTAAIAMLEEMDCEYLFINGSLNNGVDTLRYDIKNFAQTLSLFKTGRKFVIIDEADYLNGSSTQPALRSFMEEYSKNCGFILTCNYVNRIIPEIQSRCSKIEFKASVKEAPHLMADFFKRVKNILENESVEYDNAAVAKFIQSNYPDMRKVLNELQKESANGKITSAVLLADYDEEFKTLISYLKNKEFSKMNAWVTENSSYEFSSLVRKLYDNMVNLLVPEDRPTFITLAAQYQYWASFSLVQEINTAAFLTELMAKVRFL